MKMEAIIQLVLAKVQTHVIIRLKNNIEPENIHLNGGVNLVKYNSFSDFESAS